MKRIICLLLIAMTLLALVACEGGDTAPAFDAYTANGVKISVREEAAPILEALGAYRATAETNSCYGDGKDRVYEYASFRVQTYSMQGKEYILSVTVFDDSDPTNAKTAEGIKLGDTRDAVVAVYGEPSAEDSFKLVYKNTESKTVLQISLSNGIVNKIEYLIAE